jgi:hypothetical protein
MKARVRRYSGGVARAQAMEEGQRRKLLRWMTTSGGARATVKEKERRRDCSGEARWSSGLRWRESAVQQQWGGAASGGAAAAAEDGE